MIEAAREAKRLSDLLEKTKGELAGERAKRKALQAREKSLRKGRGDTPEEREVVQSALELERHLRSKALAFRIQDPAAYQAMVRFDAALRAARPILDKSKRGAGG